MMEGALDQELGYDLELTLAMTLHGYDLTHPYSSRLCSMLHSQLESSPAGAEGGVRGQGLGPHFFLFTNVSFWPNPLAHGVSVYSSKIVIDFVKCEIVMITVTDKGQSYGFSSSHVWM